MAPINIILTAFALVILYVVYRIDTVIQDSRKQSKKYDYLFTNRKKSETLRLRNKGRN